MDDLQYDEDEEDMIQADKRGFKPCYKWMTFNTKFSDGENKVIRERFKPCYKWMTFNTTITIALKVDIDSVLNLVING